MKTSISPFLLAILLLLLPAVGLAQGGRDYYPPEVLDKPLGVTALPNGHLLVTDTGGANYTTTDAAVIEFDPAGEVVWLYAGPMAFPHSANPWPDGTILVTDTGNDRVFRVNRDGEIVWSTDDWGEGTGQLSDGSHLDYPNDAELLPNGNILLSDRNNDRVLEVSETGEVVWVYADLIRPHNPDRLENGNTMVSDSERDTVLEVDPSGEIVWQYGGQGTLDWPRDADRLQNGNTLITDSRNNRVLEVTPAGEVVWEFGGLSIPYESDRLPGGNTLISDNNHKRVIEVDSEGAVVRTVRNFTDSYPLALQNGGFEEDADGNGLPDSWFPADLNAEGPAAFVWDAAEKRRGSYSAALEYHGPGRVAWLQTIEVTPAEAYSFEGAIKTDIAGGIAAYQLWFLDELGGPLGEPITVNAHTASKDWTLDRMEVTAPDEARAVQIWALSLADGSVWFDSVSFESRGASGGTAVIGVIAGTLAILGAGAALLLRRRAGG